MACGGDTWSDEPMDLTDALFAALALDSGSGSFRADAQARTVELAAGPGTDLISDPVSGKLTHTAPVLSAPAPEGDFVFSAEVIVSGPRTTYDAGALALYAGQTSWAKLCFEYSPDAEAMAVGVVTRGSSDDANGDVVASDRLFLRISRLGEAVAFHHSPDGVRWRFVRVFRWDQPEELAGLRLGFVAQSPLGEGRDVTFSKVSCRAARLADLRDGS